MSTCACAVDKTAITHLTKLIMKDEKMKPFPDSDPMVNFKTLILLQRTVSSRTAPWLYQLPTKELHEFLAILYETEFLSRTDVVLLDLISEELELPAIPAELSNADAVLAYHDRHKVIAAKLAHEAQKQILAERAENGESK